MFIILIKFDDQMEVLNTSIICYTYISPYYQFVVKIILYINLS